MTRLAALLLLCAACGGTERSASASDLTAGGGIACAANWSISVARHCLIDSDCGATEQCGDPSTHERDGLCVPECLIAR